MSINGLGSLASLLQYLPSNVVSDLVNKSSADPGSTGAATGTATDTTQTDDSGSSDGALSASDIASINVQMQSFFNQNDPLTQDSGSSDDGGYLDFMMAPVQSDLSTYNASGGVNTDSASTFSLFG